MTNEIAKKEETKPIKKYLPDEVKKIALNSALDNFGMLTKIKKIGNEILPALFAGKISNEEAGEELNDVSRSLSLDTGHVLLESIGEDYRSLAFQMKQDLHKEFDCKTASEKAMVDLAVSSYVSKLFFTRKLIRSQGFETYYHEINGYFKFISKEIDRSHRQFISTIETLKALKQPALKVNVKTNNAFIGENQQFNNNQNNEAK